MKRTVDKGWLFKSKSGNILHVIENKKITYTNQSELFRTTVLIFIQTNTLNSIAALAESIKRGKNAIGLGDVHFSLRSDFYTNKSYYIILPSI